jgi:8-oxo-dGTP pyrophosphatase MutT (NUDIX family)
MVFHDSKNGQMYVIFYNRHKIILSDCLPEHENTERITITYRGKVKALHHSLDIAEKREGELEIWIYHADLEELWRVFANLFKLAPAAGGLVKNHEGKFLFIIRNGYLDLPKGKLDPNESFEIAATREVIEETGLTSVALHAFVTTTWHCYRLSKKRYLKETRWFMMENPEGVPEPQTEEGISEVLWLSLNDYFQSTYPKYANLDSMLKKLGNSMVESTLS